MRFVNATGIPRVCQMPPSSQLRAWLFSLAEGGQTGTKCRVEALGTKQKEQK